MTEQNDIAEIESRRICCDCVGEDFLSNEIHKFGEEAECFYCQENRKTIPLIELAYPVETAFEKHYIRTPVDPDGYELALQKEGLWERSGDPVTYMISEAAKIDEDRAEDVRRILEDKHYSFDAAQIGEENPFEEEAYYKTKGADDIEFQLEWTAFERDIKTASRFFSKNARSVLDSVFSEITELRTEKKEPVVVTAGPEKSLKALYRARPFQSTDELEKVLMRPDTGLGPPPFRQAKAGRMNPQGISVFYGATDEQVAVAEVRPPVGSWVAVARFDIIRPVRILDVEALRQVFVTGSIFDSEFVRRLEHAKFLESLSSKISQPVMPNDEPFDYLVTQAIAEYLSEIPDPKLDGIIYPSPQEDGKERNVALFHHAARVEEIRLPKGIEMSAGSAFSADEADEADYYIWEEVPDPDLEPADGDRGPSDLPSLLFFADASSFDIIDYDERTETLRLDPESVSVHHIKAVTHSTSRHSVTRHRSIKGKEPF